jgi:hypothetical protein
LAQEQIPRIVESKEGRSSASEFASILQPGERIVLGDAGIGWPARQKLLLTNRRLVWFQGKGLLTPKYVKAGECSIGQIDEVYADVESAGC